MAYLSDTFIDGELYINGSILVNKVVTTEGNLPSYAVDDSNKQLIKDKRLLRFSGEDGQIDYSGVWYKTLTGSLVNSKGEHHLGFDVDKVYLDFGSSSFSEVSKEDTKRDKHSFLSFEKKVENGADVRILSSYLTKIEFEDVALDESGLTLSNGAKKLEIKNGDNSVISLGNSTSGALTVADIWVEDKELELNSYNSKEWRYKA